MKNKATRAELKKIVARIEELAKKTSDKLSTDDSVLDLANELVKNSITFTFCLGELFALEKKVAKSTAVCHNARDSRGRFLRVNP